AATDPLFAALGITSADGRVKPTRVAKFRQVQDLLGAIDPLVDDAVSLGPGSGLSEERPLRIVDLGCGNAYLTFAAFRYLTAVRELPVEVVGVDVKAQARAHNGDVAQQLDVADKIRFVESTIGAATVEHQPDLVMALHACDTATDEALARAVRWEVPVIVAAPCCHHDIQAQLTSDHVPDPYRLVTRHGILKERFADVLTDALRAAILRLVGYRVEVIEFVDSQHTPRNALIRAVRTGAAPDAATLDAYWSLVTAWGVQPALATMLADSYPVLGPSDVESLD
ncbi:MAG: SAM-dependent methyltransferase, partial [Nocardioidaceae bacterium]